MLTVTLQSARLDFVDPERGLAREFFQAMGRHPMFMEPLGLKPHSSTAVSDLFLNTVLGLRASKNWVWLLKQKSTARLVGLVQLREFEIQEAELAIGIAPEYWRRSLATEALHALLACLRRNSHSWKLHAHCQIQNEAAHKLFERCGFVSDSRADVFLETKSFVFLS